MRRRCCLLLALAAFSGGCANPRQTGPTGPVWKEGVESNIIGVHKFFEDNPWLLFEEGVDGVKITVYLEGAGKGKGVFGSGTILVTMYTVSRDIQNREVLKPIHDWELDAEKSFVWRALQESVMGWGYGLRLQWPSELDVRGREVAFGVKYVREDGRVLASRPHTFKVPNIGSPRIQDDKVSVSTDGESGRAKSIALPRYTPN